VRVLVDAAADVNSLDIIGRTPLLLASDPPTPVVVSKEQQSVVDALLNLRSNANQASSTGITPLVAAVQKDVEVIAHQLLQHGVDANSPEPLSGSRPLKIAIQRMHVGIVKQLIDHRAEVSAVDRMGQSAASAWVESFSSAYKAKRGPWAPKQRTFEDILQVLTDGRVEQAFAPCRGAPPLLLAWKQLDGLGQRAAIQMLLQARADPNSIDGSGRTLLHSICGNLANQRSTVPMMELLQSVLQARADAARESEGGDTPLDLAANAGPVAQQAFKALLDSLSERSLIAPRWSRLLFKELEGGNEQIISTLVPRTGTMHFNDLGQGPLEALLGHSLFRYPPACQQEDLPEISHELEPESAEVHIRLAELFQKHGAILPTPAWVWSRSWAATRCSQALLKLEELGEQGARHLANLANPSKDLPSPLAALLVAACVLSGVDPEPQDPAVEAMVNKASSIADCAVHFRTAVHQLLAGEGTMLLPRLACASSLEVQGQPPMSAVMLRQMGSFLEDSALSSHEALEAVGGAAAAQLGLWVKATYELHHVPRLVPVTLQAIHQRVESSFASKSGMRRRWLKVFLASLGDRNVDAEDGGGSYATHLALRSKDLCVGDSFLPLLHRGANVDLRDASNKSVLELLQDRAKEALAIVPSMVDDACTSETNDGVNDKSAITKKLAVAIAEVERCSLRLNLQASAAQQCLIVEAAEVKLQELLAEADSVRKDIEAELSETVSTVEEALEALDRLEFEDLSRSAALHNPPPALAMVMAATCAILNTDRSGRIAQATTESSATNPSSTTSETPQVAALMASSWGHEACMAYWPSAQRVLTAGLFIQQIQVYDKDSAPQAAVDLLESWKVQDDQFSHASLRDSAAGSTIVTISNWLRALLAYNRIARSVKPKKDYLHEIGQRVSSQQRCLTEELSNLKELQSAVEDASLSDLVLAAPSWQNLGDTVADFKVKGEAALATCGQTLRDALKRSYS